MTNAVVPDQRRPPRRVVRRTWSEPIAVPPPLLPAAVTGITCPVLTRAVRHVETEVLDHATPDEQALVAEVLAAVTLAVGYEAPDFVVDRCPGWPPALLARLLALVRAALLRDWGVKASPKSAYVVLRHVTAVEAVREAVERNSLQDFTASLNGTDGADALAEVLHDLRSPLSSILILAERVERGKSGPVNDLQRRQLRLIEMAALQLSMATNDAIDAALGGDLRGDDEPGPVSITLVLNAVADIVRPVAEEKRLDLRFVRPERDYRIGREIPLVRVLLNLVTNALKFTHEGGVDISAEERGDTRVEFSVRDTGPGINPSAVEQLYRPFRRTGGGSMRRFSRTGLGLAMCQRLVDRLGGTLQHESPPGGGTRFWFEIELPPVTPP